MVSAFSLWLPILLSAVFVFIASSIIHMALGYHAGDVQAVPNEEAARAAIGPLKLAPGDYCIPRPGSMKDMGSAEFKAKQTQGPVLFFTVRRPDWALMEVPLLWLSVLVGIVGFWRGARTASYYLLPYLVWVSFAAYLNWSVVALNAPF